METWIVRRALNEWLYVHACLVGVSGADGTQLTLRQQFHVDEQNIIFVKGATRHCVI